MKRTIAALCALLAGAILIPETATAQRGGQGLSTGVVQRGNVFRGGGIYRGGGVYQGRGYRGGIYRGGVYRGGVSRPVVGVAPGVRFGGPRYRTVAPRYTYGPRAGYGSRYVYARPGYGRYARPYRPAYGGYWRRPAVGWGFGLPLFGGLFGFGAPFYGTPAYEPYYSSAPYYGAPVVVERPAVVRRSVNGNFCETPVRTCQLRTRAPMGIGCSCRVSGGRARGVVVLR